MLWRGLRSAGTFVGMRGVRHPPALTSPSRMAGLVVAFGTHLELGLEDFEDVYGLTMMRPGWLAASSSQCRYFSEGNLATSR
jgi:hypothetical protein